MNDLSNEFIRMINNYPHLRTGQAWMNALFIVNTELYNKITDTEWDPFYNDDNLSAFFYKVAEYYESNNSR